MDTNRQAQVLAQSLESSVGELRPDYLLSWLSCLPDDWPIHGVEDIVRAIMGYANITHVGVDSENAELLDAADYWQKANEGEVGCRVDDGDVVLVDQDTDEEICRTPLPEWLLRIDGIIDFMLLGRDRQLCVGELRDVLDFMWGCMYKLEADEDAE